MPASSSVWPHSWLRLLWPGLQPSSPDTEAARSLCSTAGSRAHWWLEHRTSIHPGRDTDTWSQAVRREHNYLPHLAFALVAVFSDCFPLLEDLTVILTLGVWRK